MKKIIIISIALFMNGCSVTQNSAIGAPVGVSASSSLHGNIDVGDKISGSVKGTYFLGIKLTGPDKYTALGIGGSSNPFNAICKLNERKSLPKCVTRIFMADKTTPHILLKQGSVKRTTARTLTPAPNPGPDAQPREEQP